MQYMRQKQLRNSWGCASHFVELDFRFTISRSFFLNPAPFRQGPAALV